ncbi:hypothetical protein CF70_015175 [Cupriavidus sp. SK-3]|uniref:LysR substrate-binding domain-containing protein n=1 Tax=Cupriavidus sp. SK-3 TaxID=1470558 RepID=UPI00044D54D5|nr:LysR substrate-binding domain-containing protein [Cupriavidus sp. SK-3]KDP85200.1 hypothetical protein CF70_015175 [Cupriavidus sp. SK-3]
MDDDDDISFSPALKHRHIEAFRAVMIRGTTTEAALMLHASQPVISKLIARFQATSGLKLFELHKGRLVPTPEARVLFNAIERSYIGLEQIGQTIAELRGTHSGRIQVGCLPSLGMGTLPEIVKAFMDRHSGVEVVIETVASSLVKEGVASGRLDLGITSMRIDTAGTDVEALARVNAVAVMSRTHPLARKRSIRVEDLDGCQFLAAGRPDDMHASMLALFAKHGVNPKIVSETTYALTTCMLALHGAGIGVVSPFVVPDLKKLGLVVKQFYPRVPVELAVLTPKDMPISRLSDAFLQTLRKSLKAVKEE